MRIELPELPYPVDALEPYISARTLRTHHGKHHRAYVDRTNALIGEGGGSLEEIIARAAGDPARKVLFNNAAQAWNHAFFWRSLRRKGAPVPRELAKWADPLKTAAIGHFGSGWVWLVRRIRERCGGPSARLGFRRGQPVANITLCEQLLA